MHNEVNMSQRIECVNAPTLIAPRALFTLLLPMVWFLSQDNYPLISSAMR